MALALVAVTTFQIGIAAVAEAKYDWSQWGYDSGKLSNRSADSDISTATVGAMTRIFKVQLPDVVDGSTQVITDVVTPSGVRDVALVTTKNGTAVALDAITGARLWNHTAAPAPKPSAVDGYCCTFTTSSTAVDPNRQFVYSYGLEGSVHKYRISDGEELVGGGWPQLTTLKPDVEKQSGALAIATANDGVSRLYVTHAGYPFEPGDLGDYQGHITTIDLDTGIQRVFNATCSNMNIHFVNKGTPGVDDCGYVQSAIWGRPGVVYSPVTDRIYATTGNGVFDGDEGGFSWGDTVFALNADGTGVAGKPVDTYTPVNEEDLNAGDFDLGSTVPAIFPAPPGSTVPLLAMQVGKDSVMRLLDATDLNRSASFAKGGELELTTTLQGVSVLPQPAVWIDPEDSSPWIFMANYRGLTGYKVILDGSNDPHLSLRWNRAVGGTSPMVVNGVLFTARKTTLLALDPRNGADTPLWSDTTIGGTHWQSPTAANGVIYMPDEEGYLSAFAVVGPPAPVTGLTTRAEDAQVNLFWTNPTSPGFNGVTIVRKAGAAPPSAITDGATVFDGLGTTYTDVGLTNGSPYSYGVFAHNTLGESSTGVGATDSPATHSGPSYNAYLAEGYTGNPGFMSSEFLTLANIDSVNDSVATVTFFSESGPPEERTYVVSKSSRRTVSVNNEIGAGRSTAARVAIRTGPGVVVERPMYFSGFPGTGPVNGGHDAMARPAPQNRWFMAEGYTGDGFSEFLTVLNPSGETSSTITTSYLFNSGTPLVTTHTISPGARKTISVANEIGPPGRDVSVKIDVVAGPPVSAERVMYFLSDPALGAVVSGGHVQPGIESAAPEWYFAEGYTAPGFVEYLTIQNTELSPTTIQAEYAFNADPPLLRTYVIPPESRTTIRVNDEVGPGREVSVKLSVLAGPDVIAERPMYFYADPALGVAVNDGHDVLGANSTGTDFYFAEGYTGAGFVEFLTLQNPDLITAEVTIDYVFNTGAPQSQALTLAPNTRTTVNVNGVVPAGREVSARVRATSGAIVAERPMYFFADPLVGTLVDGGHDVVGYEVP